MSRFILSLLIFVLPLKLSGQLFNLSDQYLNNTLAINPAFAGCNDALSVSFLYRNQWTGFGDAPKNSTVSLHAPLNKDRVGLGFMVSDGSYGINNETVISGSYAFRMEMQKGILALGLGFGATVTNVAWNELQATDPDDMLLMNSPVTAVLPDISVGIYYYTKKLFFGFSLPMMLTHNFNHNTGQYSISNDFSEYGYFIEGGYYSDLTPGIRLLPSFLLSWDPGNKPVLNINAQVILQDRFRFGAGYRTGNILIGMVQFNFNRQLMAAYSYDFNMGTIGKYDNGAHEIALNYTFSYSRKVMGPRQF
jgi:type IX secretion system PorP/SprF family membrane protein